MATQVCPRNCSPLRKAGSPQAALQAAPQPKFHKGFSHTTHTSLQVCDDTSGSPLPDNFDVNVFDPSKCINIPFNLKSTDTTDTLINKYLENRPELENNLHLAFNGKPVPEKKILRELGVKPGAVFITFQRCTGG